MKMFMYQYQNGATSYTNAVSLEAAREQVKRLWSGGPVDKKAKYILPDSFVEIGSWEEWRSQIDLDENIRLLHEMKS